MKFPTDTNAVVTGEYGIGGAPVYTITMTFNDEEHTYTAHALDDFTAMNIMLQAQADGYGLGWESVEVIMPEQPVEEEEPVE